MTVRHIVLFKLKPSLSDEDTKYIMESLGDLKNEIPQILSYTWGKNNTIEDLDKGYTHGFVMDFKNEEDRKTYLDHPALAKYGSEILAPALAEDKDFALVFDYKY